MHKAFVHHWVRNPTTNRVGQVKGVYRDPQNNKQAGVYVKIPGEQSLVFWPTQFVRPLKRAPTKAKSKRHAKR